MAATSFILLPYVSRSLRRRIIRAGVGILFLGLAFKGMELRGAIHETSHAPLPVVSSSMNVPAGFHLHVVAPANRDFLGCRFHCPDDFLNAALPEEEVDLAKPTRFLPLAVMIANYGPVVFTVGARPAYSDGTLSEWLAYLADEEGFNARNVQTMQIGRLPALACDATQDGDGITMRLRLVLLENGGRLFQLSAMAPVQLWDSASAVLGRMIDSFELQEDHGSHVTLQPRPARDMHHVTPIAAAHVLRYAEDTIDSARLRST